MRSNDREAVATTDVGDSFSRERPRHNLGTVVRLEVAQTELAILVAAECNKMTESWKITGK